MSYCRSVRPSSLCLSLQFFTFRTFLNRCCGFDGTWKQTIIQRPLQSLNLSGRSVSFTQMTTCPWLDNTFLGHLVCNRCMDFVVCNHYMNFNEKLQEASTCTSTHHPAWSFLFSAHCNNCIYFDGVLYIAIPILRTDLQLLEIGNIIVSDLIFYVKCMYQIHSRRLNVANERRLTVLLL